MPRNEKAEFARGPGSQPRSRDPAHWDLLRQEARQPGYAAKQPPVPAAALPSLQPEAFSRRRISRPNRLLSLRTSGLPRRVNLENIDPFRRGCFELPGTAHRVRPIGGDHLTLIGPPERLYAPHRPEHGRGSHRDFSRLWPENVVPHRNRQSRQSATMPCSAAPPRSTISESQGRRSTLTTSAD